MRQTCLNTVFELAKKNKKVVFIGSDLGPGVLDNFKKKFPNRFFMEGVTEQSIIGMAAGMAFDKFRPYVNTIATFITRRCYEQVAIDVCLHNLPVTLIGNGGGLVYAPLGPTHQAIEDISIIRVLPNISIISPCDAHEMKHLMEQSVNLKGPLYVRIARGGEEIVTDKFKPKIGKGIYLKNEGEYCFLTTGITCQIALKAREYLKNKKNIECSVAHLSTIKPLDKKFLNKLMKKFNKIITIEENFVSGGFGSSILEYASDCQIKNKPIIKITGLKDRFIKKYGTQKELLDYTNLGYMDLVNKMLKFIKE
tara:strand:- start:3614 stop:4540 length:927 start_codon:yes stop_codon:yes gene_type:complete